MIRPMAGQTAARRRHRAGASEGAGMAGSQGSSDARGVLFDVDGTLVDTPYLHTVAFWQAFRQFGHDVPMAEIHRAVGMGADKLVAHVLGEDRDDSKDDELEAAHSSLYSAY